MRFLLVSFFVEIIWCLLRQVTETATTESSFEKKWLRIMRKIPLNGEYESCVIFAEVVCFTFRSV